MVCKHDKILGVTLLEVMLVLGISATIIMMSLRYYQSATASFQVSDLLHISQGITATADSLAQGTSSYRDGGVDTEILTKLTNMHTSWGGDVRISDVTMNSYRVTFADVPVSVCIQAKSRLINNSRYQIESNTCNGVNQFSYRYNAIA